MPTRYNLVEKRYDAVTNPRHHILLYDLVEKKVRDIQPVTQIRGVICFQRLHLFFSMTIYVD